MEGVAEHPTQAARRDRFSGHFGHPGKGVSPCPDRPRITRPADGGPDSFTTVGFGASRNTYGNLRIAAVFQRQWSLDYRAETLSTWVSRSVGLAAVSAGTE